MYCMTSLDFSFVCERANGYVIIIYMLSVDMYSVDGMCMCVSFLVFHYYTLSSKSWRVVMKSAKAPKLVSLPHEVNPFLPPPPTTRLLSCHVRDVIKLLSVGQADNYISGTFGSWLIFHYIYDVICVKHSSSIFIYVYIQISIRYWNIKLYISW